jgi:bifunctional ADP-heptose synthase (sugar kinase/adenylyltransferase)
MTLWLFLGIVALIGVVGMVLVYKFVMASLWSFRGRQMDVKEVGKNSVVVAVSGGFDPINGKGHISHIREARKLGDSVVLILSRDDQLVAKGNKPNGTFYPDYTERLFIMSELRSVDKVVMNIDTDGTCAETLRMVRPQIFAKGGDRTPNNMPSNELEVCREIGCTIVYNVGDDKKTSSSELVRRAIK